MSASNDINDTTGAENYVTVDFTDPSIAHDRVLVVGDQKFYVFAGHLSFCSEYFNTMFNSDFKEKDQLEIELKEVYAEDFHLFLKTLIPGNTSVVNADNFVSVMACAQRFMALSVIAICGKFAMSNFETLDKIMLLTFAFEYHQEALKTRLADTLTFNSALPVCKVHPQCSSYKVLCGYCHGQLTYPSETESFLDGKEEEVVKLPLEIQAFLLKVLITKNKK